MVALLETDLSHSCKVWYGVSYGKSGKSGNEQEPCIPPCIPLHTPGFAAHTQGYAGLSHGPLMPPKACSLTLNLILPLTAQYTYLFHVSHAALFVIGSGGVVLVGKMW